MLLDHHRSDVLHSRAISDEVIDSLPERYQSFEAGDWDAFVRFMRLDTSKYGPRTIAAYRGMVTKSGGGVVITRYDVHGSPTPSPYARFDNEVHTGRYSKTHYVYRPGDSEKHIDLHPRQPTYRRTDRYCGFDVPVDVYVALEGSLKADAILSAGATVCSSTSITTWESHDLRVLVPLLRTARRVYVVPDSDFFASEKYPDGEGGLWWNPRVRWEARRAAQWLASRGVNARLAIPWAREAFRHKLGVDDFLARGYDLGRLHEEPAYPNPWVLGLPLIERKSKLPRNSRRILEWLLKHQGMHGSFLTGQVARVLKIDPSTVWRSYKRLEQEDIMKVWQGSPVDRGDGTYSNEPHSFLSYAIEGGYKAWLESIPLPAPVRQKVRIDGPVGRLPEIPTKS